jgi:hypothetical protein
MNEMTQMAASAPVGVPKGQVYTQNLGYGSTP